MSATAPTILEERSGLTEKRKLMVSALTIHTSKKLAVIQIMSYLSRDSRIRTTIIISDSAADTAGRRNSSSQKKLRRPQVRRNTAFGTMSPSLHAMRPRAAR